MSVWFALVGCALAAAAVYSHSGPAFGAGLVLIVLAVLTGGLRRGSRRGRRH